MMVTSCGRRAPAVFWVPSIVGVTNRAAEYLLLHELPNCEWRTEFRFEQSTRLTTLLAGTRQLTFVAPEV